MTTKGMSHDESPEPTSAARPRDGADDRPAARGDRGALPAVDAMPQHAEVMAELLLTQHYLADIERAIAEPWPEPLAEIAAAVADLEQNLASPEDTEYVRMSATLLQWQYARTDLSGLSIGETLRGLSLLSRIGDLATRQPVHIPTLVPAVCVGCRQPILGRYVNDDDARALRCDACRED